ncbi:MAG: sulfatase [Planctomycetota bacterium]
MISRPNVVFITAHDVGRHLGCYGQTGVRTPALDRLAQQGVRCDEAYCTTAMCSPSRASFVTGRYPHSHGVIGLVQDPFGWDLHNGETHLAAHLAAAGYDTALAGLQHETRQADRHGLANRLCPQADADTVAAACEAFLVEHARPARPFYLQVGLFEPHRRGRAGFGDRPSDPDDRVVIPRWLRDDDGSRREMAAFQAATTAMDRGVGRIMDALDQTGLAGSTLVVFAADHGLPFPRAKASLYDPGLEIALLWRWPEGGFTANEGLGLSVSGVDILPTIFDVLDLDAPAGVEGRYITRALRGQTMDERPIFAENNFTAYRDPMRAVRTKTRKLIVNFAATPAFYDTSQQWRPPTTPITPDDPRNAKHPVVELYDLEADPIETRNLADDPAYANERLALLADLAAWMRRTDDPLLDATPIEPRQATAARLLQESLA